MSDNGCSAIAPSDAAQLRNTPARRERCHRISVSPLWAHRHRSCAQVRPQYGAPEKPKQTQRGKTCVRYIAHSAACNRNPDRARRSFMFASIRLPWICTRRGTRLLTLLCLRRCGNCHVVKCKGGQRSTSRIRPSAAGPTDSSSSSQARKHLKNKTKKQAIC